VYVKRLSGVGTNHKIYYRSSRREQLLQQELGTVCRSGRSDVIKMLAIIQDKTQDSRFQLIFHSLLC